MGAQRIGSMFADELALVAQFSFEMHCFFFKRRVFTSYPLVNQHSYGTSPSLIGKSTIDGHTWAIFNRYVELLVPEGMTSSHFPSFDASASCFPAKSASPMRGVAWCRGYSWRLAPDMDAMLLLMLWETWQISACSN